MQRIKDHLVRLGPQSFLVQTAMRIHARSRGFSVVFENERISLQKSKRKIVLNIAQYVQVPFMMENFDLYFEAIEHHLDHDLEILDFSKPALHRYSKAKIEFYFPSIPEDDVMEAYLAEYVPNPGDVIWDVGAHAGATTHALSQLVGPDGKVFAFEPDNLNYEYLIRNIELHKLRNVVPVKKALAGASGTARFNMDGTMSAGLTEYLTYKDERFFSEVTTRRLSDACDELGSIPNFVKMDIEGSESAVIEGSTEFIRSHPIRFSIESNHQVVGEQTSKALERAFRSIRYNVHSSDQFGQMFTWASPPPELKNVSARD